MAKVAKKFKTTLTKNKDKGGAWLVTIDLMEQQSDGLGGKPFVTTYVSTTAWSNASAGKRFVKAKVQELTPRKSIKLETKAEDENGKPTLIVGEMEFKAERE